MKRVLLLLGLAGAAVYAVDARVTPQYAVAVETHPAPPPEGRRLRSWGTYLSDLPLVQKPQTHLAAYQKPAPLPPQQNADTGDQQNADTGDQPQTSASESDDLEQELVEWAKVTLAVKVHSAASVSSATIRYYRPGTELQVVKRDGGWVGVSDPVTQERGWVFEKYLASIDAPTPAQAAVASTEESELSEPALAKPAVASSKKRIRPAVAALRVSQATPVSDDAAAAESDAQSRHWGRGGDGRGGLFGFFGRF